MIAILFCSNYNKQMTALLHGVPWIHTIPAVLAVVCGFLYLKTNWVYLKVVWGILWLLLIPNTAYLFIDIERITLHWSAVSTMMRVALVLEYVCLEIIGLVTFLLAMLPFESMIRARHFSQKQQILASSLFNFLIGFGMVLGRTGYTNSYVVFTQPTKVFLAVITIVISPHLLGLTIFCGVFCNSVYVIFRNMHVYLAKKFL